MKRIHLATDKGGRSKCRYTSRPSSRANFVALKEFLALPIGRRCQECQARVEGSAKATTSPLDGLSNVSSKALAMLRVLEAATQRDPLPAKSIARKLWPEKLQECGTALKRGGLYRAAGAYCSKLQRQGFVGYFMDDFQQGYYLTEAGRRIVDASRGLQISPGSAP